MNVISRQWQSKLQNWARVCVGMTSAVCVWRLCACVGVRTRNKQRLHAWWRLGGLEHFGDVLLRQRRLPSALSLGVLLLPPLQVLEGGRNTGGIRGEGREKTRNSMERGGGERKERWTDESYKERHERMKARNDRM